MGENRTTSFFFIFSFLLTGLVTGAGSFFCGKDTAEIVRSVILTLAGSGTLIYLAVYEWERDGFDYDNGAHAARFMGIYIVLLLCAAAIVLLPPAGWPYLPIYIVLGLFGNRLLGIFAGTLLLTVTVLCSSGSSIGSFFMYFVAGTAGVLLFGQLDEEYRVGRRAFVSALVLFAAVSAEHVLSADEIFSPQLFLLPAMNLFVSLLLLLIVLKYFSGTVIHKNRNRYDELNDPECPLLSELKEQDREEYFHAVHTAYLCGRSAKRLGFSEPLMKAGGYYHHIGRLKGENTWENIEAIGREYHFPDELLTLLKEYSDHKTVIASKETVAVLLTDAVTSVIRGMFKKDAEVTLNYPLLLDAIFEKKLESGQIDGSAITMEEIKRLKNICLEEKLYYDFLR